MYFTSNLGVNRSELSLKFNNIDFLALAKDKMTIFEWDHYFVDREWIYTAITRCNKIGNVLIYNGGYKTKEFNKQKLECYLTKKISGYITQDNKMKRKKTIRIIILLRSV